jgi:hypothetical protein
VSIAVVVSAATYYLKQILPDLKSKERSVLQYFLKYDTYVLKAPGKVKALTKIRYSFLNHFLSLHAKLPNITLATLYSRSKPPGWRRPPLSTDFNFYTPGFPHQPVLVRPSRGCRFTGNLSAISANNPLHTLFSHFSKQSRGGL